MTLDESRGDSPVLMVTDLDDGSEESIGALEATGTEEQRSLAEQVNRDLQRLHDLARRGSDRRATMLERVHKRLNEALFDG
ncbi:hypothetical protein [Streptomyces sp. NPDC050145]|uniref:hypothetical protein n=1 Tax=Streptomyces sp. NPDC050145 TaxID=3365602 RepID=UPI00378C868E